MTIETIIIVSLAAMLFVTLSLYSQATRHQNALRDLIINSPAVCLICGRGELGHETLEDYGELDPVHRFVHAHLVYLPDKELITP